MNDFDKYLAYAMVALSALSALVPFMRFVASKTASKTDDAAVEKLAELIHDALRYVPTIRFGAKLETQRVIKAAEVVPALKEEAKAIVAQKETPNA